MSEFPLIEAIAGALLLLPALLPGAFRGICVCSCRESGKRPCGKRISHL
jgi:hypothetical protein